MKKLLKYFNKIYSNLPWIQHKRRLLQKVKWAIRFFFEGNDDADPIVSLMVKELQVTDIRILQSKNPLRIQITTERPGLLIGKGGRTHNSLKEYLSLVFDTPVEIRIKESRLWL